MKKLIMSTIMCFALMTSTVVLAKDTTPKKDGNTKAKTECTKKDGEKKACCTDKKSTDTKKK